METTQNNLIEIQSDRNLGLTAKVFLQEKGRMIDSYNHEITCEDIGKDSEGNEIKVDTIGRWLFGVPGCDGHIRVTSEDKMLKVYYPKNSSNIIHSFLLELKQVVEKN